MNLQALSSVLGLLVSLTDAQASTPTAEFNRLCPAHNGQEVEIQPGLFAKYHCNKATAVGVISLPTPAADADACVLACAQNNNCVASLWSRLSGNSNSPCRIVEQNQQDLRQRTGFVYITYRRDDVNPFLPDDCEEENERIESLEQELELLRQELLELESDLESCQSSLPTPFSCAQHSGRTFLENGVSVRITCEHFTANTNDRVEYGNHTPSSCAKLLAQNPQYQTANYAPNVAVCSLQNGGTRTPHGNGHGWMLVERV